MEILNKLHDAFIQGPADKYFVYAIAIIAIVWITMYVVRKRIDYNYKKEVEKEREE